MGEIRVGVSACLTGEQVHHDGRHKRNAFLLEELGRYVRFVPVCPEVGIGLGVPRETLRLVRRLGEPRLIGAGAARLRELDLSGFVLKRGSPSCGLERVKVGDASAEHPSPTGRGVFAAALVQALPGIAIEEEGRLNDPGLREQFVDRVYGHARVRDFFSAPWTGAELVRFHAAEKMAVLAHHPDSARRLGRLVATQRELAPDELARRYRAAHAKAFQRRATSGRQANALMHLAGHVKASLASADRLELREAIEDYRAGLVPVAVPLALLSRHLREEGTDWARSQAYLRPYPKELGLRGQIAPPVT